MRRRTTRRTIATPSPTVCRSFAKSIAGWYQRRFGVTLDPDKEVLPLIGSKEGIANIAYCLIDPGDVGLVPDPGYPVYSMGTMFAGGETHYMPLKEENDFLPDFSAIPEDVARRAKVLWLNYPNAPTAAVADIAFFDEAVRFAKQYDIAICHDAPYTEVAYDGYKPISFMQADGARDVGIEFHSLSKSFNMTGWRIGMAVGNPTLIDALFRIKSNVDSGINQAVQRMAITALDGPQDCIEEHNADLPAPPRRPGQGAAGLWPAGQRTEGQPLRLGQSAVQLHRGGVRGALDRRHRCRCDARQRLRPVRRRLHPPLNHDADGAG